MLSCSCCQDCPRICASWPCDHCLCLYCFVRRSNPQAKCLFCDQTTTLIRLNRPVDTDEAEPLSPTIFIHKGIREHVQAAVHGCWLGDVMENVELEVDNEPELVKYPDIDSPSQKSTKDKKAADKVLEETAKAAVLKAVAGKGAIAVYQESQTKNDDILPVLVNVATTMNPVAQPIINKFNTEQPQSADKVPFPAAPFPAVQPQTVQQMQIDQQIDRTDQQQTNIEPIQPPQVVPNEVDVRPTKSAQDIWSMINRTQVIQKRATVFDFDAPNQQDIFPINQFEQTQLSTAVVGVETFRCQLCNFQSDSQYIFQEHRCQIAVEFDPFANLESDNKCPSCGLYFDTNLAVLQHQQMMHPVQVEVRDFQFDNYDPFKINLE